MRKMRNKVAVVKAICEGNIFLMVGFNIAQKIKLVQSIFILALLNIF